MGSTITFTFTGNLGASSHTLTGTFRCTKMSYGNPVKGVVDLTITATSTGAFTMPT